MSHKKKIEEEVRKTMEVLDDIRRVETREGLFNRISARMEREGETGKVIKLMPPAAVAAVLILLIAANLFTYFKKGRQHPDGENYELVQKEYNMGSSTFYDF